MKGRVFRLSRQFSQEQRQLSDVLRFDLVLVLEEDDAVPGDCNDRNQKRRSAGESAERRAVDRKSWIRNALRMTRSRKRSSLSALGAWRISLSLTSFSKRRPMAGVSWCRGKV